MRLGVINGRSGNGGVVRPVRLGHEDQIEQGPALPGVRRPHALERAYLCRPAALAVRPVPPGHHQPQRAGDAGRAIGRVPGLAADGQDPGADGAHGCQGLPQTGRLVLEHRPGHRAGRGGPPHGHGGRHLHGPWLVPDHRRRRHDGPGHRLAVVPS